MIGERVAGKYSLDKKAASGPGGEVWRGEDVVSGRKVLVLVRPLAGLEEDAPRRLKELSEELREVRHAGAPAPLGAGVDEDLGVVWAASEDAKGELLSERMKKARRLPPDKALELCGRVAEVLGALHHQGLVHGALSPAAILLGEGDAVSLLYAGAEPLVRADYAARRTELLAEAEANAAGRFVAPERAEGAEPVFQTDTYCLALLFAYLVAGKTPFFDQGLEGFERFLPKGENPRLMFPPDLGLGEGVLRALSKSLSRSPSLRHLTPKDLLRAIADDLRPAAPLPPPKPAPPAAAREPSASKPAAAPAPAAETPAATAAPSAAAEAPKPAQPLRRLAPEARPQAAPEWRAYAVVVAVLLLGALGAAAFLGRGRIAELGRFVWENRGGREIRDVYDLAEHPSGRSLETIVAPKGEVRSVSFSDGGRYMAAASSDGAVQLWLTEDWALHRVFKGHEGPVSHVRFGARASVLYTGGADGRIFKWDLSTGKGAEIVTVDAGVSAMAVTPDERNLAYASDGSYAIYVQDVVWGQTVRCAGHRHTVTDLAFSANGRYLASSSDDGTAKYWDAAGGDAQGTMGDGSVPMTAVALHPSDSSLVSGDEEGRLVLWNIDSRKARASSTYFHAAVTDVVFAPDGGSLLASGADGRIARFSYPALEPTGAYSEHEGPALSLAVAPKADVFASSSSDRRVKIWRFADGLYGRREGDAVNPAVFTRAEGSPLWRGPGGAAALRTGLRWYETDAARADAVARNWADAMGGAIPPHVLLERARGVRYEAAESQRRLAKTVRRALADQDFAAIREEGGKRDFYRSLPPERFANRFAYRSEDFFALLEAYERSGQVVAAKPVTRGAGQAAEPIVPAFGDKDPDQLFEEGMAAVNAEKFPEARAKFEKILEIDKRPISPLRDLAAARLGELDKIAAISAGARRLFEEGLSAALRGETAEARRLFENVVQVDYRGLTQYPKRAAQEIAKIRDKTPALSPGRRVAAGEELGAKEKTKILGLYVLPDKAAPGTLATFKIEYEIEGLEPGRSTTAEVFHSVEGAGFKKSWKDRAVIDESGRYESLRTLQIPAEAKPGEYEYTAVVDPQGVYGARASMAFSVAEKAE